jgi:hypothetical protein
MNLTIISTCAPTEDKGEEEKLEFYSRAPKYEMLIIMGTLTPKWERKNADIKYQASTLSTNIVTRIDRFWFSFQ